MPLGMQVGFGPGNTVSDSNAAPPQKGGHSSLPHFLAYVLWPNGWMAQDGT